MSHTTRMGSKCATASVTIVLALLAFALLSTSNASAASHATAVVGTVRDSAGTPAPDVSVTVNMKNGETVISTHSESTDELGEYSVLFLSAEWEVGYTIEVIATFHGNQESNSTTATDSMTHTVDVTFTFEIPDFGSEVGLIAAGGAIGLVAAVVILRKRK
jgi:hypothetical protein